MPCGKIFGSNTPWFLLWWRLSSLDYFWCSDDEKTFTGCNYAGGCRNRLQLAKLYLGKYNADRGATYDLCGNANICTFADTIGHNGNAVTNTVEFVRGAR